MTRSSTGSRAINLTSALTTLTLWGASHILTIELLTLLRTALELSSSSHALLLQALQWSIGVEGLPASCMTPPPCPPTHHQCQYLKAQARVSSFPHHLSLRLLQLSPSLIASVEVAPVLAHLQPQEVTSPCASRIRARGDRSWVTTT